MTLQEVQNQALQLPISDRWRLVQSVLASIQQETLSWMSPSSNTTLMTDLDPWTQRLLGVIQLSPEDAKESYLERIQVASITDEVIRAALQSSVKDFEDAVTSEAALAAGLDVIVTRNIADFLASPVPVMLPEEFLASLSEST